MHELQGTVSDRIKMIRKLILLFLILNISCNVSLVQDDKTLSSPTPIRELKENIPNAIWVKIYFEGIDKIVERNNIYKLRGRILAEDDFEIRFWVGFGIYGNDGLILKRSSGGNWTATYLSEMSCHLEDRGKYNLESPKSGWETTWEKLVDAGLLTLPDSSELEYEDGVSDGKSYVVEINFGSVYRTYEYGNPKYEKVKEAKQIMNIGKIIVDEFGLESFSAETGGCKLNE